jgi:hypothetical protein
MFPVREDEIVAFQHAQSQSGEGICHPFRSINFIPAVDDFGVFLFVLSHADDNVLGAFHFLEWGMNRRCESKNSLERCILLLCTTYQSEVALAGQFR